MEEKILKNRLVIIGIAVLLICVGLSGCAIQDQGFCAEKLDVKPKDFYTLSDEYLKSYPHLKEVIIECNITGNMTCISVPREEHYRVNIILSQCNNVKYKNEFYEITLYCAD